MTLQSKFAVTGSLSDLDRRSKRRKISTQKQGMTHSRPLPSPPDLKIQDYEELNSKYMIEQSSQQQRSKKSIPLSPPLQPSNKPSIASTPSSLPLINDLSQFHALDILHDPSYCMFKIQLDKQNTGKISLNIKNYKY